MFVLISGIAVMLAGCTSVENKAILHLLPPAATNLEFANMLIEDDSFDHFSFEYVYNGAGIGIGDFNNDGLPDIFFAGNAHSSALYLNSGNLKFMDVSAEAGVVTNRWCTGVAVVDINNDGLKDIYLCVAGYDTAQLSRRNIFYINQGIDENGIPTFIDMAPEMGLDDAGYSTMAVFFDYDKDGDLDVFILTNSMDGIMRSMIRPIRKDGGGQSTDRLYRNNGNMTFTNVSAEAGILHEGYGLGVGLADLNEDGWPDIYCSNDFISNDLLYINNRDGTFSEQSGIFFKHFTHNGMGMDFADFNNDGLTDLFVLDMLPPDNMRQKLMLASNTTTFESSIQAGYHPQFLRNTLQLNRGKFRDGRHRFSEISFLSGVYNTDWSWAPLFIDLDNDGWKDLLISNGFRKDVTNMDYIVRMIELPKFGTREVRMALMKEIMKDVPDVKLVNFVFKNNGDLTFSDKSAEWGMKQLTFSNGAAFADFDNDGDLDMVFNNIDQQVSFYENRSVHKGISENHFLNLRFEKTVPDYQKIGLKVRLYHQGNLQFIEYSPFRGYKSTMDELIHFGMGAATHADSLLLTWPDGHINGYYDVPCNATFYIGRGQESYLPNLREESIPVTFREAEAMHNLNFSHSEAKTNDFDLTPTLLRSMSHFGPSISTADINLDGREDFFLSGDAGHSGTFFIDNGHDSFHTVELPFDAEHHDVGSLLFDFDGDGDADLYVVSGGYKWPDGHDLYQDRIYINDGNGNFIEGHGLLPHIRSSGSCVIAADYDLDGDLDLFVGGRVVGQKYGLPAQSYLLRNDNGVFSDQSHLLTEKGGKLGMVTSALWTDLNNDQRPDLIIVGEWMPVTVLINEDGKFTDKSSEYGLLNTGGWWNSIHGADLDNDGDIDYVLGNYGLNSFYKASEPYPLRLYAKDFDLNGTLDPLVTYYNGGMSYFVHTLDHLIRQIPAMQKRFPTYSGYGSTVFEKSFTKEELSDAVTATCRMMGTVVLENRQNQSFVIHELPLEVQFAPVFGLQISDLDGDGYQDLILIGNSMHEETIFGFYDASFGNVLHNQGNFKWAPLDPSKSGFNAEGDVRSLVNYIGRDGKETFVMTENGGPVKMYVAQNDARKALIHAEADDWYLIYTVDGRITKRELYYGAGFLSASSRIVGVPGQVDKVEVYKYNGTMRTVDLRKKTDELEAL